MASSTGQPQNPAIEHAGSGPNHSQSQRQSSTGAALNADLFSQPGYQQQQQHPDLTQQQQQQQQQQTGLYPPLYTVQPSQAASAPQQQQQEPSTPGSASSNPFTPGSPERVPSYSSAQQPGSQQGTAEQPFGSAWRAHTGYSQPGDSLQQRGSDGSAASPHQPPAAERHTSMNGQAAGQQGWSPSGLHSGAAQSEERPSSRPPAPERCACCCGLLVLAALQIKSWMQGAWVSAH